MLVPISTYISSDNFKNFRETFIEEVAANFELLDKKFSTYNVDDMLQKRIDQTNSCAYLFFKYTSDNVDFITGLDTSNVTNMSYMFSQCTNLTTVPAFDTSKVTNMNRMFSSCESLTAVPTFDTSNVTDMTYMFNSCESLTAVPTFDTSNVTSMKYMFSSCRNLTTIPQLDTGKVTDMSFMFGSCGSLITVPALDTSKVTNMSNMFNNCKNIEEIHMVNIGANLDIHWSTKMTHEALLEVLSNLKDLTGSTSKKLTLGSTLLTKLTDDDKAIATNKNWTLA